MSGSQREGVVDGKVHAAGKRKVNREAKFLRNKKGWERLPRWTGSPPCKMGSKAEHRAQSQGVMHWVAANEKGLFIAGVGDLHRPAVEEPSRREGES